MNKNLAAALEAWLALLDCAPTECDGASRSVSTLLLRENVPHQVHCGELKVRNYPPVLPHFWIELDGGYICDFRAQLNVGDHPDVPHGIFIPAPEIVQYRSHGTLPLEPLSDVVFQVITGLRLDSYEAFDANVGLASVFAGDLSQELIELKANLRDLNLRMIRLQPSIQGESHSEAMLRASVDSAKRKILSAIHNLSHAEHALLCSKLGGHESKLEAGN